ncbi:unnamed protein product [Adineta steineri]|uniref:Uncharacterized protein n=1 Tax=Adineta steineri TaxID=433720 RepID=A0A815PLX4_9BILA|nr:unnamed protein product [Adineta steineri]
MNNTPKESTIVHLYCILTVFDEIPVGTILLEHGSNICVTVQYISDAIEDEITTDNIKTRLWALPDAPADREALVNI